MIAMETLIKALGRYTIHYNSVLYAFTIHPLCRRALRFYLPVSPQREPVRPSSPIHLAVAKVQLH